MRPINDNQIDDEIEAILSKVDLNIKKKIKRRKFGIMALIAFVVCACVGSAMSMRAAKPISKEELQNIKEVVKIVSRCEGKMVNKIYWEIKKNYDVRRLENLSHKSYEEIYAQLQSRNCIK